MSQSIHTTFMDDKTSKIRWKFDPFNDSNIFITGSWDNKTENNLKLWEFQESTEDLDIYPFVLKHSPFQGDVTELLFVDLELFAVSSSVGSLHLINLVASDRELIDFKTEILWDKIHYFKHAPAPCTSFSYYKNDIVTCGEDGRINLLTSQHSKVVYTTEADSCAINCVAFLKFNEILTGNSHGLLKIWDFRQNQSSLCNSIILGQDHISLSSVAVHPSQQHIVVTGDEEGSLTFWDLRNTTFPANLITVHTDRISEIKFHPDHPDHIFSCSDSGEMWHWMSSSPNISHSKLLNFQETIQTPWYLSENVKSKVDVYKLMPKLSLPINSFDLCRNKLICGSDYEAIYLINDINVK